MDDQCAVNADGTLKDPCDIEWEYSPTQKLSALPLVAPPSPLPAVPGPRSAITFGAQLTPARFAATQVQGNFKNLLGKDAPNAPQPPKPVAFDCVKAEQAQSVASSDAGGETDDNGDDDEPSVKKVMVLQIS